MFGRMYFFTLEVWYVIALVMSLYHISFSSYMGQWLKKHRQLLVVEMKFDWWKQWGWSVGYLWGG